MLIRLRKLLMRVKKDLQDYIVDSDGNVVANPTTLKSTDDVIFKPSNDDGANLLDLMLGAVDKDPKYLKTIQFNEVKVDDREQH